MVQCSLKIATKYHVFHRNLPHGEKFAKNEDIDYMYSCRITDMPTQIHDPNDTC